MSEVFFYYKGRRCMAIKVDITVDVREEAFHLAERRNDLAVNTGRPQNEFNGKRNGFDMDFQGAYCDIITPKVLAVSLAQPLFINSWDTAGVDFIYNSIRIEGKCALYPPDRVTHGYFINIYKYNNALRHGADGFLLTSIDREPELASAFYIYGYISSEEAGSYPVNNNYHSPAYEIPFYELRHLPLRGKDSTQRRF